MGNELFRQESLERISSPEQMRDYMRVTSPRLWMLLAAMIALLAGFLVYASTTTMETLVELRAEVYGGLIFAEIQGEQGDMFKVGMTVRIGGKTAEITDIMKSSRLRLRIRLDSGETLTDGNHELVFLDGDTDENAAAGHVDYDITVSNGEAVCVYDRGSRHDFASDRRVRIDGKLGTVTGADPVSMSMLFIELMSAETESLPDGNYQAAVVTESTSPMQFLLN